jgi:hypothetical protein
MATPINNALVYRGTSEQKTILSADNRTVRHDRKTYLVRSVRLGRNIMASAEEFPKGGTPINLFGKDEKARAIRALVDAHCFS